MSAPVEPIDLRCALRDALATIDALRALVDRQREAIELARSLAWCPVESPCADGCEGCLLRAALARLETP